MKLEVFGKDGEDIAYYLDKIRRQLLQGYIAGDNWRLTSKSPLEALKEANKRNK